VDPRAGRARIDRGGGSALVVIPKGLQDAILNNRPYHLQLVANAAQSILPKIVEEVLRGAVDGGFSLNLSPPLIQLETTVRNNRRNMGTADLFFPNMIFMGLLLMANGLSKDIWKECTHGTLRRLLMSPSSLAAFLTGRLAMVAMAYSAFAIAAVAAARYLAGVHVSNMAAAAAWAAVAGTVFYLFLLPLAVSSAGQRGADVRGNLLIFPLAMLGGCFFPFEVMPEWLARIGRLTPNGMAVVQFRDLLAGSVSPVHLAAVLAGLCTFGLLAFLLTLRRLRRGFLQ
jgi:ABC-2 type transport system permease protein